jgi:uncharacterized protein (DUF1810 family)
VDDPFDLARFVTAQEPVMLAVRRELQAGRKQSHWMWFVFPQLHALGRSPTALRYGITGLPEARAYLAHPVLGPRLRDCTGLVLAIPDRGAEAVFGAIDAMKLRSSMTLFAAADPAEPAFAEVLRRHYAGAPDPVTTALLAGVQPGPAAC